MAFGSHGGLARVSLTGASILVVEDDAFIAMGIKAMLQDSGCMVLGPLASVSAALAMLEVQQPAAVLLDLKLADGLATPIAAVLTARGVPFALLTGMDGTEIEAALSFTPRLGKPFGSHEVEETLRRLLSERLTTAARRTQSQGFAADR